MPIGIYAIMATDQCCYGRLYTFISNFFNLLLMSNDLRYHKKILQKVSFDLQLFRKELIKAYEYLSTEDQILLKKWVSEFVSNKSDLKTVYLGVIS